MFIILAGLSEDSDYTSDVGYPIQHSVAHHQLSTNVHHANSPAFQFGANAPHQLASGQYDVQVASDIADPFAFQSSSNQLTRKLPQVQPYPQFGEDIAFTAPQFKPQTPRKLPMVVTNDG